MTPDIRNEGGELDRRKVIDELHRIIDHDFRPDEDELMSLIDAVAEQTWADAVNEANEMRHYTYG